MLMLIIPLFQLEMQRHFIALVFQATQVCFRLNHYINLTKLYRVHFLQQTDAIKYNFGMLHVRTCIYRCVFNKSGRSRVKYIIIIIINRSKYIINIWSWTILAAWNNIAHKTTKWTMISEFIIEMNKLTHLSIKSNWNRHTILCIISYQHH